MKEGEKNPFEGVSVVTESDFYRGDDSNDESKQVQTLTTLHLDDSKDQALGASTSAI